MLIVTGKHNFQEHTRMMLEEMGIEVPEGGDVLSMYRSIFQTNLVKENKQNFQVHEKMKLEEMSVKVREGDDVNSMYQSINQTKLVKEGKHNLQVNAETIRKNSSKQNRRAQFPELV